jgi:hypothetical protein
LDEARLGIHRQIALLAEKRESGLSYTADNDLAQNDRL